MKLKVKNIGLFIATGYCGLAHAATPVFGITPAVSSVTIAATATDSTTWTVVNNLPNPLNNITLPLPIATQGNAVTYTNNTCTGSLAPGNTCTFNTTFSGANQPAHFTIAPVVCAYNGLVCANPFPSDNLSVTVNPAPNAYAYIPTVTIINDLNSYSILPINTAGNALATSPLALNQDFAPKSDIAVSPDSHYLYFMNAENELVVAYTHNGAPQIAATSAALIIQPIATTTPPVFTNVVISPDGKTVYVGESSNNYVYAFDVSTPTAPVPYDSNGGGSQGTADPIRSIAVTAGDTPNTNEIYIATVGQEDGNSGIQACSSSASAIFYCAGGAVALDGFPHLSAIAIHGHDVFATATTSDNSTPSLAVYSASDLKNGTATLLAFSDDLNSLAGLTLNATATMLYVTRDNPENGTTTAASFSFDDNSNSLNSVGRTLTFPQGGEPSTGIAITPDDTTLIIPQIGGNSVYKVNISNFSDASPTLINIDPNATGVITTNSLELDNFIG